MNKPKLTPEQRQQIKIYKSIQRRLAGCFTDMLGLHEGMTKELLNVIHGIDLRITTIERGQQ